MLYGAKIFIFMKIIAMKNILLLIITLFTFASCNYRSGSGNIISETRTEKSFDGISVGGDFDVEVKIGSVTNVVVEADDNIIKYIKTTTSGNTLKIQTEGLHNFSDVHMKVYITTPALVKIKASASAKVIVQGALKDSGKLTFGASSGAEIQAAVDAPEVNSDVSSGANINLSGKTKIYTAEASSGAEIRSWDLLSENTMVSVSSGAAAKVHASVTLNAKASSGGSVTYHGAASVIKSESSGGSVNKKD